MKQQQYYLAAIIHDYKYNSIIVLTEDSGSDLRHDYSFVVHSREEYHGLLGLLVNCRPDCYFIPKIDKSSYIHHVQGLSLNRQFCPYFNSTTNSTVKRPVKTEPSYI